MKNHKTCITTNWALSRAMHACLTQATRIVDLFLFTVRSNLNMLLFVIHDLDVLLIAFCLCFCLVDPRLADTEEKSIRAIKGLLNIFPRYVQII
jgi:hypothetical protein